ncbi:MAG: hypothetical protein K9N21_19960 [Deltaproteobacteria bacterium]|nr:hypothetical protein [Deltaproteobacteria bacterium]
MKKGIGFLIFECNVLFLTGMIVLLTVSLAWGQANAKTSDTHTAMIAKADVWSSGGPNGGYVTSIAVAPSNTNIVYIGTVSGMYKSTNGGESWLKAGLYGIEINVIRVDPTNPNIVCAGVGKMSGYEMGAEDGFYKSTDGGGEWKKKYVTWVTALAIDPRNPDIIFLGTKTGEILKSEDGGDSWILKHTETDSGIGVGINSIVVDPENSSYIYVGTGIRGYVWQGHRGFLKSADGGETWTSQAINPNWNRELGYSLVITPAGYSPQTLYIIQNLGDLYKSTDKGETWTSVGISVDPDIICVNPIDPDWLYVADNYGDFPLIMYNPRESIWEDISAGLPSSSLFSSIAINPTDSDIVYVGYDQERLYTSADGGTTWNASTIKNSNIHDIAISPTSPNTALVAIEGDRHIQKTVDQGGSWTDNGPYNSLKLNTIAIDRSNASKRFIGTIGGNYGKGAGKIYRTIDGGETWSRVDSRSYSGTVRDIWIHPANSNIVLALKEWREDSFYIYYGGVRRSKDGGDNWTQVKNWSWPKCLCSDPVNPDVVYLGVESKGYLFRSDDAGETWTNISLSSDWVNAVYDAVVDSTSNVYAATSDGIWKWNQSSWTHLNWMRGQAVTAVAIDLTEDNNILYAGTVDSGIYISANGGKNWSAFNNGLGVMNITKVVVSETKPKVIYAGTAYDGVWSRLRSEVLFMYVNKDDDTCDNHSPCYTSIQDAVNNADSGSNILIAGGTYTELITLNYSKSMTLQGGWDMSFQDQSGTTILRNAPKAPQGSLTLQELIIKP